MWAEQSLDMNVEFFPWERDLRKVCGLILSSLYQKADRTIFFFCHHRLLRLFVFFFSPHPPTQVVYFTEMYNIFSELTDQIDQAGLTDEQREKETEAKLSELRALSIVADDWRRRAEETGKGSFSCLSVQTDGKGLNLIISLFPCGLINQPTNPPLSSPRSSCTTLPCFILRLQAAEMPH